MKHDKPLQSPWGHHHSVMEGARVLQQKRAAAEKSTQPQKRSKLVSSDMEEGTIGGQVQTKSELEGGRDVSFKQPHPPSIDKGKETRNPNVQATVGKVKEAGVKRRAQAFSGGHDTDGNPSLIGMYRSKDDSL